MSVASPTPRRNSAASSKVGVRSSPYPNRRAWSAALLSTYRQMTASSGRMSCVPRGDSYTAYSNYSARHLAGPEKYITQGSDTPLRFWEGLGEGLVKRD